MAAAPAAKDRKVAAEGQAAAAAAAAKDRKAAAEWQAAAAAPAAEDRTGQDWNAAAAFV